MLRVARAVIGREDRAEIIERDGETVIVVADGAGGTGSGAAAADAVIAHVKVAAEIDPLALLTAADRLPMNGGETTCVIAVVTARGIHGASVGDSEAWIFGGDADRQLTHRQNRKPLLGSGSARPVPFAIARASGTLVVATDGLWKYAKPAALRAIATSPDLDTIPTRLIDLVRLRSGDLQDDVAIIVCRE
jgi:serine/threonine protein phosphatase PrpC